MHADTDDRITVPWVLQPGFEPVAEHLLRRYFGLADGTRPCTGAWFEIIGRRWDDPDHVDVIDAVDLIAARTLSVDVPARAAIAILGEAAATITSLLRTIPADTRLTEVDEDFLQARDGAPQQLCNLLRSHPGMGATTTSKVLARKRPHLFPIFDSVLESEFRLSGSSVYYTAMHRAVNADGQELYKRAEWLAESCAVADRITPLRVIDVVTWMHGKDHARSAAVKTQVGLAVPSPRDPARTPAGTSR